MMRIIDTLLAVPTFVLLIIVASMFAPSLPVIILILSALSWLGTARLVRGEVLALRTREFNAGGQDDGGDLVADPDPPYGPEHPRRHAS